MKWKEFFKPSIGKIIFTIPSLSFAFFIFSSIYFRYYYLFLTATILFSYILSCSLIQLYKRKKVIGIFMILIIGIPFLINTIFVTSFIFACGGIQSYPSSKLTPEDFSCQSDSDCRLISLNCCKGCKLYSHSVNINAYNQISEWKKNNCKKCCMHVDCFFLPINYEPVCIDNVCKIQKNPRCEWRVCDLSDSDFSRLVEDLNMSVEEIKERCNCTE